MTAYTDADVELLAHALADACPTPDQCADTHDECVRRHGIHWLSVGPGGLGEQHITAVEGDPRVIARIALAALTAADRVRNCAEALADPLVSSVLGAAVARLDGRVVISGNPCCGGNGVEASCPECREVSRD